MVSTRWRIGATAFYLLICCFYFGAIGAAQKCYFTDGSVAQNDTPCNTTAKATTCCQGGAACLTGGLCYLMYDGSTNAGSCTDKSWKNPNCFQSCSETISPQDGPNTLYRCNNNDWCCSAGGNTTSCCDDRDVYLFNPISSNSVLAIYNGSAAAAGFTIAPVAALAHTSTSSVASDSSSANGAATSTLASSTQCANIAGEGNDVSANTPCPTANGDNGDTTKVGVGVGVGVGVPLLAALGAVLFLWLRERRISRDLRLAGVTGWNSGDYKGEGVGRSMTVKQPYHEMGTEEPVRELPGTNVTR